MTSTFPHSNPRKFQREIDDRKPPLIQRYASFRGLGTREFEMQRLQDSLSFKSPNSVMEICVRDRRLLRGGKSNGPQDFGTFPETLTAHHASPLMDSPDSFGTSPLHYSVYRDFVIISCKGKRVVALMPVSLPQI
jgi:hypothetical protein